MMMGLSNKAKQKIKEGKYLGKNWYQDFFKLDNYLPKKIWNEIYRKDNIILRGLREEPPIFQLFEYDDIDFLLFGKKRFLNFENLNPSDRRMFMKFLGIPEDVGSIEFHFVQDDRGKNTRLGIILSILSIRKEERIRRLAIKRFNKLIDDALTGLEKEYIKRTEEL